MTEETKMEMPMAASEIPTFLQQDGWFGTDLSEYWLQDNEKYEQPVWTLSWCGIPFAPLGNIHALTGQSGHGKTMTFSQMIVALLKGSFGQLRCELPEEIEPSVLYIDTEMGKNDTLRVRERVYRLMGWKWGEHHEELKILRLRDAEDHNATAKDKKGNVMQLPSAVVRWRATLQALYEVKPTVAILDGLLDVVADFNDNTECAEIIYKCMRVSSYYGISLWCLVHQNPGQNVKMVGHLGSTLERKVTDIFTTVKEKDKDTGAVTFTVKQGKARSADVKDWKFCVDDDLDHVGIPRLLESTIEALPSESDERMEYRKEMDATLSACDFRSNGKSWTELTADLKKRGIKSNRKIQKLLQDSTTEGILTHADNGRYYYHGLGGGPKETQSDMPFVQNEDVTPF